MKPDLKSVPSDGTPPVPPARITEEELARVLRFNAELTEAKQLHSDAVCAALARATMVQQASMRLTEAMREIAKLHGVDTAVGEWRFDFESREIRRLG